MKKWEVMRAYYEGATVQYKEKSPGSYWVHTDCPQWHWYYCDYRVTPPSKLRPWKPEEFPPVGTAFRWKGSNLIKVLMGKNSKLHFQRLGESSDSWDGTFLTSPEDALCDLEYSIDQEQTWHPCGIEEEKEEEEE